MSALEQEIVEKFHQLEANAKRRVLDKLTTDVQSLQSHAVDYDAWWAELDELQANIRAELGVGKTVGALDLLDELREEASWVR